MSRQGKSSENLESEIGLLLAITSQLFTTRVAQVVGGTDLTYTQFAMLNHLQGHPDASISDLAGAMEINQPGVSKVVQRLSEVGLVTSKPDPGDSRRKKVAVTSAGTAALGRAQNALADDGDEWFDGWSKPQLAEFRDRLAQLATWLDENRIEPS